ncbi:hypothetical protein GH714_031134 [Hevea brasiliensis]|uniref:Uncharacterized protein n=1 Tax=Hevea brasiliensis TaxID=3981 RepID=A0A6A6LPD1_HEVBR|nr:hypothetical protein GH714_031134 [Hevea brasiliensis]
MASKSRGKVRAANNDVSKGNDRDSFGNIVNSKYRVLAQLEQIQRALEHNPRNDFYILEEELRLEYERILTEEELYWYQKSCSKWLSYGDRNTRYFHSLSMKRSRRNRINMLKDDSDQWCEDQQSLKNLAVQFFSNLYFEDRVVFPSCPFSNKFPLQDPDEVEMLGKNVGDDEIRTALFQMDPMKAQGLDGYNVFLFQKNWHVIGRDVCSFVKSIFCGSISVESINQALIVLIPKKLFDEPSSKDPKKPRIESHSDDDNKFSNTDDKNDDLGPENENEDEEDAAVYDYNDDHYEENVEEAYGYDYNENDDYCVY